MVDKFFVAIKTRNRGKRVSSWLGLSIARQFGSDYQIGSTRFDSYLAKLPSMYKTGERMLMHANLQAKPK